ncbi:MAG: hypothetical protein JSU63_17390 [Phycisphaerales bacterium]|nr:MAG: hypothetical protein JSU63_17390 [Phycisphaerales bacterium]
MERTRPGSSSALQIARPAHCPQCAYRIDYVKDLERCPECGLALGADFVAFGANRVYMYADRVVPYLAGLGAACCWWTFAKSDDFVWSSFLGLSSLAMTAFVIHRLVGLLRFTNRTEFMIVNQSCIRWKVHGRPDVTVHWVDVRQIRVIPWYDWVILILASSPRIRFVPARFRPQGVSVLEFGGILERYQHRPPPALRE